MEVEPALVTPQIWNNTSVYNNTAVMQPLWETLSEAKNETLDLEILFWNDRFEGSNNALVSENTASERLIIKTLKCPRILTAI